jgi:hypothetical protein
VSNFDDRLMQAAQASILKMVSDGRWIEPDYANRFKVPAGFLAEIWALVDVNRVKLLMAQRIEAELADRVVNHMAAELATDVKQLLSDKERREALRAVARKHLDYIVSGGERGESA